MDCDGNNHFHRRADFHFVVKRDPESLTFRDALHHPTGAPEKKRHRAAALHDAIATN
jgi:hypothetical protein